MTVLTFFSRLRVMKRATMMMIRSSPMYWARCSMVNTQIYYTKIICNAYSCTQFTIIRTWRGLLDR